jgi:hypothetical protein
MPGATAKAMLDSSGGTHRSDELEIDKPAWEDLVAMLVTAAEGTRG